MVGTLLGASNGTTQGTPSYGVIWAIIIFFICYARRKKAIGGWLLYYFIQLYAGSLLYIGLSITGISNYNPTGWENIKLYLLYLLTTIPETIFLLCQFVLSFWMIPVRKRSWKIIKLLKLILVFDIIFSLVAVAIDSIYWPETSIFSILGLIWPTIWLPYFARSKRIRSVYQRKDWDDFRKLKPALIDKPISQNQLKELKHTLVVPKEPLSDSELAKARVNIGATLLNKGDYDDAEKEYKGAIRLVPDLTETYYGLASCYACRNMKNEALENLRLGIEKGYKDWPRMIEDKNFKNIKDDPWFKMLAEVAKKRWEEIE